METMREIVADILDGMSDVHYDGEDPECRYGEGCLGLNLRRGADTLRYVDAGEFGEGWAAKVERARSDLRAVQAEAGSLRAALSDELKRERDRASVAERKLAAARGLVVQLQELLVK